MVAKKGRPPNPDKSAIMRRVLVGLSLGQPLSVVAEANDLSHDTVTDWAKADPLFAEAMVSARSLGWDRIAAECLEIADDSRNDWMDVRRGDGTVRVFDPEHVRRSELRINTRMRLLAVWDKQRYSQQTQVKVEATVAQTTTHSIDPRSLDDAGRAALRALLAQAAAQGLLPAPGEGVDAVYEIVSERINDPQPDGPDTES